MNICNNSSCLVYRVSFVQCLRNSALAITPSHPQNTHDFADGRKNMNDIFNNYVCSASHMHLGLHFQNV